MSFPILFLIPPPLLNSTHYTKPFCTTNTSIHSSSSSSNTSGSSSILAQKSLRHQLRDASSNGDIALTLALFQQLGNSVTTTDYNLVLTCYRNTSSNNTIQNAYKLLQQMKLLNIPINHISATIYIKSIIESKHPHVQYGFNFFYSILQHAPLTPSSHVHIKSTQLTSKPVSIESANMFLQYLVTLSLNVNSQVYRSGNTKNKSHRNSHKTHALDDSKIERFFHDVESRQIYGLNPTNRRTHNIMLRYYLLRYGWSRGALFVGRMLLRKCGDHGNAIQLDVVSYNVLLDGLLCLKEYRGVLNSQKRFEMLQNVMNSMNKQRIRRNLKSYTIMHRLYSELSRDQYRLDEENDVMLIDLKVLRQQIEDNHAHTQMQYKTQDIDKKYYHAYFRGCGEHGMSRNIEKELRNVEMDEYVMYSWIQSYSKSGNTRKVKQLFVKLLHGQFGNAVEVNEYILCAVVDAFGGDKQNEIESDWKGAVEMLEMYFEKEQSDEYRGGQLKEKEYGNVWKRLIQLCGSQLEDVLECWKVIGKKVNAVDGYLGLLESTGKFKRPDVGLKVVYAMKKSGIGVGAWVLKVFERGIKWRAVEESRKRTKGNVVEMMSKDRVDVNREIPLLMQPFWRLLKVECGVTQIELPIERVRIKF